MHRLSKKGYTIEIIFLDRGNIGKVLAKELPQFKRTKICNYSSSTIGKMGMVLSRFVQLMGYLRRSKPQVTAGVGDFLLGFCSKLSGRFSILYYDDFEFNVNFKLSHVFGDKLVIPDVIPVRGSKIVPYKGFKELAYLHPSVYTPNKAIVKKAGLKENGYVFVREVASISLNYASLRDTPSLSFIKYLHHKKIPVVLSLEDKSKRKRYEPYCTILEEPLEDVYSLMHYALFTLTSGDSMARESALLGVPAIFIGGRDMLANKPFIAWGGLKKIENETNIFKTIDAFLDKKQKELWSKKISDIISKQLVNTSEIIETSLLKALKK